jgi:hypothetical protein
MEEGLIRPLNENYRFLVFKDLNKVSAEHSGKIPQSRGSCSRSRYYSSFNMTGFNKQR